MGASFWRPQLMDSVWVFLLLLQYLVVCAAASANSLPGCRSRCGDVDVPYPFGIGPSNCAREGFALDCNRTENGLKKLFVFNVEVINISLLLGQATMLSRISAQCYNDSNTSQRWRLNFIGTPYRFSDKLNQFTVVGCDSLAYIGGHGGKGGIKEYQSGCVSMCQNELSLANGSCSGIGCCQTAIPKDLKYYDVLFDGNFNSSRVWNFSRCTYAILLEANWFKFQTPYITTDKFIANSYNGSAPVVVDWAIENKTCDEAKLNPSSYACVSGHSVCLNSSNGPGYRCECSSGYQGNPYIAEGCTDINECIGGNPCSNGSICKNLPGSYDCVCPRGTYRNFSNKICTPHETLTLAVKVSIGISVLAFLLICSMCIYTVSEKRKLIKVKKRYFREHGGRLLLEEIKAQQGLAFKIFTKEELEKATDKFDKNLILGQGGYGTVYRGVLEDKRIVAIKKPKIINEAQKNEFGKEMLILSQINHKNIVKLLGCCLEVEVPMLVYEFISNGTLYHQIHDTNGSPISLATRLRIAYESADALAYLHSSASPPIIHSDVKTSNILIGENCVAKISDFGASKLVPKDEDQFATLVQGTCGYLDPEYLQTCQLTEKSDVYSFGIVLLELLTSKKVIYFEGPEENRSLVSIFDSAMEENRLLDIFDSQVKNEGNVELIIELCELIKQCVMFKGDERPAMKEVAEELARLRKFQQHPWVSNNSEEIESLLGEPSHNSEINDHIMDTTTPFSLEKRYSLNIRSGR